MEKTFTFENLPEQRLYANILFYLTLIGLFILLTGFTLYLTGVITPIVPLEELPQFWSLSLNEYMEKSNMPSGWQWISNIGYGDIAPMLGIAVLASVTFMCSFMLLFQFIKRVVKIIVPIVSIELLLILLSASNLVQVKAFTVLRTGEN